MERGNPSRNKIKLEENSRENSPCASEPLGGDKHGCFSFALRLTLKGNRGIMCVTKAVRKG